MNKERFHKTETIFMVLLCLFVVIGIICETATRCGYPKWVIPDLRNVSLVVLQIQAGISTLAVALLALVSGMTSEEIYGISVTKYYMHIRPKILKQSWVIIASISLCFVGVAVVLLGLYNIVFSLFFCEWLLITISVIEILPVFSGRKDCQLEILDYLVHEIKNRNHCAIIDLLNSYESKPDTRNLDVDILWKALNSILLENTADSISILHNEWCAMLRVQLKSDEAWIIKRGLVILQETYSQIWEFIIQQKDGYEFSAFPEIFENLNEECRMSLDHLSMGELKECFKPSVFLDFVSCVNSWFLKKDLEKLENSFRQVEWFSEFIAYLLSKKQNEVSRPLSDYDLNYWGRMLYRQIINSCNIPEELKDRFLLHRCKVYLGYTISLIVDGHNDLFDRYYLESELYWITGNPYVMLFRLSVACYLYYLAEEESKDLVPPEAEKCAELILSSKKFKDQFTSMLQQVSWKQDIGVFQFYFDKKLEKLLQPFERFKDGHIKKLIIDSTVNFFLIFVQSYIADIRFMSPEFVEKTNEECLHDQMLLLLDGRKREETKEKFGRLYELLITSHPGIDSHEKANSLFYQWEKLALNKYKIEKKSNAHVAHNKFIQGNIEEELKSGTEKDLIDYFQNRFGSLMNQDLKSGDSLELNLLRFTSDTEYFLSERSLQIVYNSLDGIFVMNIADYLNKKQKILKYDRSEKNDFEFMNDLENCDLFVGSEYPLLERNHNNWKVVRDFIHERNCIFVDGVMFSLAIRSEDLKFAIRSVGVTIHEPSLDDDVREVKYIEETGQYSIKLMNDIAASFTKEEAESYLKEQKKIAEISVNVVVQAPDKSIGYLIEKNE